MAYIPQVPENERNKFGLTDPTTPTPAQGGGSSGAATQGQGGAAPGVGTPTQFGSNAAKLSDYLKANEPQVAAFGDKVAGKLTEGYNQAKGGIDTGFGTFGQQVSQGYSPYNEELVNRAAATPSEFVKNQEDVNKFKSIYNNQYQGPQNFEGTDIYSGINRDINKAVENSNLVNNFSGLGSYLRNFMGTGQNTPGMNTLDTALLQRSKPASDKIRSAAAPYKDLSNYLGTKTQEANQLVQGAKGAADLAKDTARSKFVGEGGAVPTFEKGIQDKTQTARNEAAQRSKAVEDFIDYGNFSNVTRMMNPDHNQVFQDMGLRPEQLYAADIFSGVKGIQPNWANYLQKTLPEVGLTPQNVASSDDYANYLALSQLTGQDPTLLNQSTMGQAGTGNTDLIDFGNFDQLVNELKAAPYLPNVGQNTTYEGLMDQYFRQVDARNNPQPPIAPPDNVYGNRLPTDPGMVEPPLPPPVPPPPQPGAGTPSQPIPGQPDQVGYGYRFF